MKLDLFIYVGGPLDGLEKAEHHMISSALHPRGENVHRYRLKGTFTQPERDCKGRRVLQHVGVAKAAKKKRCDDRE